MSLTNISESLQTATKDYDCNACEWIKSALGHLDFSFSELGVIALAKHDNYKIKKGDVYLRQSNNLNGSVCTFRARPEVHEICLRRGVYELCL